MVCRADESARVRKKSAAAEVSRKTDTAAAVRRNTACDGRRNGPSARGAVRTKYGRRRTEAGTPSRRLPRMRSEELSEGRFRRFPTGPGLFSLEGGKSFCPARLPARDDRPAPSAARAAGDETGKVEKAWLQNGKRATKRAFLFAVEAVKGKPCFCSCERVNPCTSRRRCSCRKDEW